MHAPENSNGNLQASSSARYYHVGFTNANSLVTACGPTGAGGCSGVSWNGVGSAVVGCNIATPVFGDPITTSDLEYAATAKAFSGVTPTEANTLTAASTAIGQNAFIAGAGGSISSSTAVIDIWTINEGKYLRNLTNGAN